MLMFLIDLLLDSMLLCYCDHELPPSLKCTRAWSVLPLIQWMRTPKLRHGSCKIIAGRLPSQLRQVIKNCQNYRGEGRGGEGGEVCWWVHPLHQTCKFAFWPHLLPQVLTSWKKPTYTSPKEACLLACLLVCGVGGQGGRGRREFLDDFSQMNEHEHEQATHNAHAFDNESTHNQVCISHKLLNEWSQRR